MGKTKFVFDNKTGTLKAADTIQQPQSIAASSQIDKTEEVKVDLTTNRPAINEPIVQFRQNSDYTIFEVDEEKSRKPMMIIAGYGLEIKFNIAELRTTERIEQLLQGVTSIFRKMILEQALQKSKG